MSIENAIRDVGITEEGNHNANLADGLLAIAYGLQAVARSIDRLGNNDAATNMGAIEALSVQMREGFGAIAEAITYAADAEGTR